jgi:hypothetical protein
MGDLSPTGALRERIVQILQMSPLDVATSTERIESTIAYSKSIGFDYTRGLIRELHLIAMRSNIYRRNSSEVLKYALRIHYLIEPVAIPPTPLEDRLSSLSQIILYCEGPHP